MAATRPYLLLDVDGVLNPFAAEVCPERYRECDFFPGEEPVRLADVHGEWLRDLARTFELVWATGWGHQADRFIAPTLGLPRLPVILFPRVPFDPALKVPAIHEYVGDRPTAWLDDIVTAEAQSWAAARTAPTLLVAVDPAVGLTAEIVVELKRWAVERPIEARASVDPIGEERV